MPSFISAAQRQYHFHPKDASLFSAQPECVDSDDAHKSAQFHSALALYPENGYLLAWDADNGSDWSVSLAHFNGRGERVNAIVQAPQTGLLPAVVSDNAGKSWLGWQSDPDGNRAYDIVVQPYTTQLQPVCPVYTMSGPNDGSTRENLALARSSDDAGLLGVWNRYGHSSTEGWDIYGALSDDECTIKKTEFLINKDATAGNQYYPTATKFKDGFLIAWADFSNQFGIKCVVLNLLTNTLGNIWTASEALVRPSLPKALTFPNGNVLLAYQAQSSSEDVNNNIYGCIYGDVNVTKVEQTLLVNASDYEGSQEQPALSLVNASSFLLGWKSVSEAGRIGLLLIDSLLQKSSLPFSINDTAYSQFPAVQALEHPGDAVVAWSDCPGLNCTEPFFSPCLFNQRFLSNIVPNPIGENLSDFDWWPIILGVSVAVGVLCFCLYCCSRKDKVAQDPDAGPDIVPPKLVEPGLDSDSDSQASAVSSLISRNRPDYGTTNLASTSGSKKKGSRPAPPSSPLSGGIQLQSIDVKSSGGHSNGVPPLEIEERNPSLSRIR